MIYPPRCCVCGDFLWAVPLVAQKENARVCAQCLSGFKAIEPPYCTICGKPFTSNQIENHPCEDCLRNPPFFQTACAPWRYEGPLMEAIHGLKYGQKTFVADILGQMLSQFVKNRFKNQVPLLVMPVPLHSKRLRERGFNQSLLLAKPIAKNLNWELDFLSLKRIRYTPPQTKLSRKERLNNVQSAFHLKKFDNVHEKNILLVDDVTTTGSTLNECARVLLTGGAKAVLGVTLAKAVL